MNKYRRTLILTIISMLVFSIPFSYAYWGGIFGAQKESKSLIKIASYADEPSIDRLPVNTPDYILNQILDIKNSDPAPSQEVLDKLVDGVISILETLPDYDHADGKVIIAPNLESVFNGNQTVAQDSLIIYVSEAENGEREVVLIHVAPNSNVGLNSPEDIINALEMPWTGVNKISSVWQRGNLYTTFNTAVEYQGKYYLMYHNGPSGTPPPEQRGTWFEYVDNLEFMSQNNYFQGYIVKDGDAGYYIANQTIWSQSTRPSQLGWGWGRIDEWAGAANVGNVVYTLNEGKPRFWRCTSATTAAPNEANASAGLWLEINNGWIGNGNTITSYYFEHNRYFLGDVVIFGVSSKLKHRYYRALKSVPLGEHPLKQNGSIAELNSEYWESVL